MIEISNAIPLPKVRPHRSKNYPWNSLRPGESFPCPEELAVAKNMARYASKKQPTKKFIAGRHEDHVRVWRIT